MNEDMFRKAVQAHQAGNFAEAARLYADVLRANPRHFAVLFSFGYLYYQTAQFDQAERLIAESLRVNPRSPEAFFTRGCALQRLNRAAEAVVCFDSALALKPDFVEAQSNRGAALMALNRNQQALDSLDVALAMAPNHAGAWNNRGCVLQKLGRNEEAVACFNQAIAHQGKFVEAFINRGTALAGLKRYQEAADNFERAVALNPEQPYAQGHHILYRMHACDWRNFAARRADVLAALQAGKRVIYPFVCAALSDSIADQLQCARIMAAHEAPPSPAPLWRGERYRHERIRVAYVSADFHAHATAALMAGVWEQHDRNRFETIAVSFGRDDGSDMRARVAGAFDRFLDVRDRSDREIASLIRQLEVDIAVDLKGYTLDHRSGIFAHRAAPVQASYLGFPGTMGAPYIDYIVADPVVIPPEHRGFYTEQIAYLPDTYQCNDSRREAMASVPSRRSAGLPENGFVFCCFNNSFKIAPEMFDLWMRILREIPDSVLWLLEDNRDATRNMREQAQARGIAPERLVFAPRVTAADHLARHKLADLFLDTMPYGAHTTASDALWAGLPVVTMLGPTFAARVAGSLLHAVGMPELIAETVGSYEALALRLARSPAALDAARTKLAGNRDTHPLFDTTRFTRNLEAAYFHMWDRTQRGEPPMTFFVGADASPASSPSQVPYAAMVAFSEACTLAREQRNADALASFDKALAAAPRFVEALVNRGVVLLIMKRFEDALQSLDAALEIDPARFEAWNNRGNALSELGRHAEAVESYDKALTAQPDRFETLVNRGNALLALRRAEEALASYETALRVVPDAPDALNGRANALFEMKRFDDAIAAYERLIARDPQREYAPGILAFSRLQCCDWSKLTNDRERIASGLRAGRRVINPFQNLALSRSPEEQRRCAAIWAADKYKPSPRPVWTGERYHHDRLRVAYVSADLRNHAVGIAMAGVLEHHDRSRFETTAVSWGGDDGSPMRTRLLHAFERVVDADNQSDTDVARYLREMEIDVAVDLMGYTGECRPGIFAARFAPVQINFLGYPGTMAAPYIDYLIADRTVVPEGEHAHYAEKIVCLPGTYLAADSSRRIGTVPPRKTIGLPENGSVFACFNNSYKFSPELFDVWMRLLQTVDGSVLWLSSMNAVAKRNLVNEARLRGVDADRIIFAPFVDDPADHLARLACADLFLDTLPYNAHATASDALFAGLPVLTCKGTTFAGRVAASLLHAAGLPELVTDSLEAYEAGALKLARDPSLLTSFKTRLAEQRAAGSLFDSTTFTRNLESVYLAISEGTKRSA
jgi:predicted O-linked N-acetylglucosamine transferase (SPINDLY family)